MKRFGSLTVDDLPDVPGSQLSLLDGDCGQHRQWLTISIDEIRRVAEDEYFRMLRQLQRGSDSDSSRARPLDVKRIQHGSRLDARRPDHRGRGDLAAVSEYDSLPIEVREFGV